MESVLRLMEDEHCHLLIIYDADSLRVLYVPYSLTAQFGQLTIKAHLSQKFINVPLGTHTDYLIRRLYYV